VTATDAMSGSGPATGAPWPSGAELVAMVGQFLGREARLLDEGREEEWYGLLADDLLYTVPVRQSTEPRSAEFSHGGYRLRDTKRHVRTRIDRLATGKAYSEVPPSRTLRVVGSIEIVGVPAPDVVEVTSALLLYRQRGIEPHFDLIPCRRNDRLRLTTGGLRLLAREVVLTETVLATPNLGVFL
jgi:3-phenylpropionate/cinnamic acid dioxygenase small subunit